jgi:hypothetical protein
MQPIARTQSARARLVFDDHAFTDHRSLLVFLGSGDFLVRGGIEQAGHFREVIGF